MDMITPSEKARLEARLASLKANRAVLSQRIADARALGDISENAEFHSAREQQALDEAEIRRLEARLASAHVVDESPAREAGMVFIGSLVRVRDVDSGREEMLKIVGQASEDPPDDYDEVTLASPMGQALLKAHVGQIVSVHAPRGLRRYEVVELL